MTKTIESALRLSQQKQLKLDCQTSNVEIEKILNQVQVLESLESTNPEITKFLGESRRLKVLDCDRVNASLLGERKSLIFDLSQVLESESLDFRGVFCADRNLKRQKYEELMKAMKFRYRLVKQFQSWLGGQPEFTACNPTSSWESLRDYVGNTDILIVAIDEMVLRLQELERQKKLRITIECKFKSKVVNKTGFSPRCTNGYREITRTSSGFKW
jgi:hypothetical protein